MSYKRKQSWHNKYLETFKTMINVQFYLGKYSMSTNCPWDFCLKQIVFDCCNVMDTPNSLKKIATHVLS